MQETIFDLVKPLGTAEDRFYEMHAIASNEYTYAWGRAYELSIDEPGEPPAKPELFKMMWEDFRKRVVEIAQQHQMPIEVIVHPNAGVSKDELAEAFEQSKGLFHGHAVCVNLNQYGCDGDLPNVYFFEKPEDVAILNLSVRHLAIVTPVIGWEKLKTYQP